MNAARILYPVRVLGPGNRLGLWLCGCKRACPGCSNPELWEQRAEYEISVNDLLTLIRKIAETHPIDGFTISGGEPFDQAGELAELLAQLSHLSRDVLIYTGYQLEELRSSSKDGVHSLLDAAAVVIDGPYVEALNCDSPLKGSSNQRIHILKREFQDLYDGYLSRCGNRIQNFTTSDGIVSVGIHHPGFTPRHPSSKEA